MSKQLGLGFCQTFVTFLGYLNFKDVYQLPKLQRSYSVALWLLDRKKRESSKAVNQYPIDYSKGLLYRADYHRLHWAASVH